MNIEKTIDNIKMQVDVLQEIYEDALEMKSFAAYAWMDRYQEMQVFFKRMSDEMNNAVSLYDVENGNDF